MVVVVLVWDPFLGFGPCSSLSSLPLPSKVNVFLPLLNFGDLARVLPPVMIDFVRAFAAVMLAICALKISGFSRLGFSSKKSCRLNGNYETCPSTSGVRATSPSSLNIRLDLGPSTEWRLKLIEEGNPFKFFMFNAVVVTPLSSAPI